jgi:hypothetical protein
MKQGLGRGARRLGWAGLGWVCLFLVAAQSGRGDVVRVGQVAVYSGTEVDRFIVVQAGGTYIAFPGARPWALCETGGPYSPMPWQEVAEALGKISYPFEKTEASVVILPVPRREVLESSAEGGVVFLSPGSRDWPREHVHYTVAHEMGHVLHNALMPDSRLDLWREYAALRGLDFEAARAAQDHAYRLHEIFAEDFRVLFGSELARCGSGVENHDLSTPDAVPGLREFFLALPDRADAGVAINASPNPFSTYLVITARSADRALGIDEVVIYDVRGRAITALKPAETGGEVTWDGRSDDGRLAAPGLYFLALRAGSVVQVRKIARIGG